jgi:hypothetical protein
VEEVYVSGYEHPIEHYGQFYLEAGDAARAQAVREAAMATARQFIGETAAYGFMVYNLGCFYVKIGRAGRSLPALGEALARVPPARVDQGRPRTGGVARRPRVPGGGRGRRRRGPR